MGSIGFFNCAVIGLASWAQHLFKSYWTLQECRWSKDRSEVQAVHLTFGKRVGPSRPSRSKPFEWEKGLSLHRFSKWVSAIIYVTHVFHVSVTLINLICFTVHTHRPFLLGITPYFAQFWDCFLQTCMKYRYKFLVFKTKGVEMAWSVSYLIFSSSTLRYLIIKPL